MCAGLDFYFFSRGWYRLGVLGLAFLGFFWCIIFDVVLVCVYYVGSGC